MDKLSKTRFPDRPRKHDRNRDDPLQSAKDLERCTVWMPRKKRSCTGPRYSGSEVCCHHYYGEGGKSRVSCPIDPSHTIFVGELEAHSKVCPLLVQRLEAQSKPWFHSACNFSTISEPETDSLASLRRCLGMNSNGIGRATGSAAATTNRVQASSDADAEVGDESDIPVQLGYVDALSDPTTGAQDAVGLTLPSLVLHLISSYIAHVPMEWGIHAPVSEGCTAQGSCLGHRSAVIDPPCAFQAAAEAYVSEAALRSGGAATSQKSLLRHTEQQAALARGMHAHGMLRPECTFLEFGAGKGGLSLTVDTLCPGSRLLLVERAASGGTSKADKHLRRSGADFERIRVDIGDLRLQGIPQLWRSRSVAVQPQAGTCPAGALRGPDLKALTPTITPIVAIGKHLCGGATDLSLRSLVNGLNALSPSSPDSSAVGAARPYLAAVAIATCCHHACTWEAYVGQAWWRDVVGGTAGGFEALRLLCGWAVCGDTEGRGRGEEVSQDSLEVAGEVVSIPGAPAPLLLPPVSLQSTPRAWLAHLSRGSRITIGRMAKRLIDTGRVAYLKEQFALYGPARNAALASNPEVAEPIYTLSPSIAHYVGRDITLENSLLLATTHRT